MNKYKRKIGNDDVKKFPKEQNGHADKKYWPS